MPATWKSKDHRRRKWSHGPNFFSRDESNDETGILRQGTQIKNIQLEMMKWIPIVMIWEMKYQLLNL